MIYRIRRPGTIGAWYALVLGIFMLVIALLLLVGGIWLVSLGGSPYYLVAGLGMIVSALLIADARRLGAWIYIGIFVLTFIWALWEVGLDIWNLIPRVFAPAVLVLLVLPLFRIDRRARP